MNKAIDVALYVINTYNRKSNFPDINGYNLQPILFLIQAHFLKYENRPCFEDEIIKNSFHNVIIIYEVNEQFPFMLYSHYEKYNVSRDTISDINNGHSYVNKKLTYPIRKLKYISNRALLPEQVKEVYNLLKNTNLTIKEISRKFSISDSAISDINKGITYFNDEISYPIRTFDASTHNRKLTDEQVDEIIDKLKNTKISQREIGRMFNTLLIILLVK